MRGTRHDTPNGVAFAQSGGIVRFITTDIRARYTVKRPFHVPYHRGGMIHGLLGRALRRTACAEQSPCRGACAHRARCDWSRLFDPVLPSSPGHCVLKGAAEPPGPIVPLIPPP